MRNNILTPTQIEYLDMLANGHEPKEMGLRFSVTKFEVYYHLSEIRKKLGAHTNPHAAVIGIDYGIVKLRKSR